MEKKAKKKKYPLPSNWALSNQLDSLNRDLQEYIYIVTELFS